VETQIYAAFGLAGNLTIEGKSFEQVLVERLEKRGSRRWRKPFQKNILSERLFGAILDTPAKIGTKESGRVPE
jgi:hypothetical protein